MDENMRNKFEHDLDICQRYYVESRYKIIAFEMGEDVKVVYTWDETGQVVTRMGAGRSDFTRDTLSWTWAKEKV